MEPHIRYKTILSNKSLSCLANIDEQRNNKFLPWNFRLILPQENYIFFGFVSYTVRFIKPYRDPV